MNKPGIIKYPFWQMTAKNPKVVYACVNQGEAACPKELARQSICPDGGIGAAPVLLTAWRIDRNAVRKHFTKYAPIGIPPCF